jgi:hypothetical protein
LLDSLQAAQCPMDAGPVVVGPGAPHELLPRFKKFAGLLATSTRCSHCSKISSQTNPFSVLTLEMKGKDLTSCLQSFLDLEVSGLQFDASCATVFSAHLCRLTGGISRRNWKCPISTIVKTVVGCLMPQPDKSLYTLPPSCSASASSDSHAMYSLESVQNSTILSPLQKYFVFQLAARR